MHTNTHIKTFKGMQTDMYTNTQIVTHSLAGCLTGHEGRTSDLFMRKIIFIMTLEWRK